MEVKKDLTSSRLTRRGKKMRIVFIFKVVQNIITNMLHVPVPRGNMCVKEFINLTVVNQKKLKLTDYQKR